MRESQIEAYLVEQCKKHKIFCRKLQWIGQKGAPDRLLAYKGFVFFVELKTEIGFLDPWQVREHTRLLDQNLDVKVIRSLNEVDSLITRILSTWLL